MAETKGMKQAAEREAEARRADYWEEEVPVYIPRPEGETQASKTITLNGVNYQIQYGKQVMVPRKIAAIIDESERNHAIAQEEIESRAGVVEEIFG